MVRSFHENADLARKNFTAAWDNRPDLRSALNLVRDHYNFSAHTHAAIHFIMHSHLDDAITKIMRDRSLTKQEARTILTSAIEHGPKEWKDNFEFLLSKGVTMAGGRCFILPTDLRKGTPHDTAFQQLAPQARQIAERALGYAVKHGKTGLDFSYGPLTQQYLVAQLMSEGAEKDFRLTALSIDKDSAAHLKQMTNSAHAARYYAKERGIRLEDLNIVLREGRAVEAKPAEKKPPSKLHMPSMEEAKPSLIQAANDIGASEMKELRQSLTRIVGQNGITRTHAQMYLYLSNMTAGAVPTHEDAAKKFGLPEENIPAIVERIEKAFDLIQTPPVSAFAIKR